MITYDSKQCGDEKRIVLLYRKCEREFSLFYNSTCTLLRKHYHRVTGRHSDCRS